MILRPLLSSSTTTRKASYSLWVKVLVLLLLIDLMVAGWWLLKVGYVDVKFGVSYQNYTEEDIITPDEAYDVQDFLDFQKKRLDNAVRM